MHRDSHECVLTIRNEYEVLSASHERQGSHYLHVSANRLAP